jgi:HK97 gp10 family phage protein
MAGPVKLKVDGLPALGAAFKTLTRDVQDKVARAATNAGTQVFKKRIAQLAPVAPEPYKIEGLIVQPKNIQRNVVVKRLKPSETPATSEHIVVVRGKRKYGYASRVATLQEFGTVKQPAQPFFRPGAAEAAQPAVDALKKRFKTRIEKAIKDASK